MTRTDRIEERQKERRGEAKQSAERKEGRQRERERYGKEEDAWSGQDRRANGGHRTEMASGSAFQYSTLATLGHPTSSAPRLPPSCPPSCSSASSASLSLVPTPCPLHTHIYTRSCFLSLSLFLYFFPSIFPSALSPVPIASSSFSAAVSSLSDRSSASSFGLRVLLFRSSAFLSFRSFAGSDFPPYGDTADESILRTLSNASSSLFLFPCLFPFSSLSFTLFLALSPDSPCPLSRISRSYAYFSIKLGD